MSFGIRSDSAFLNFAVRHAVSLGKNSLYILKIYKIGGEKRLLTSASALAAVAAKQHAA
jgi:hypothetical protein